MNKKILIAAGAIVISSAIGLTIAMRASGATATVSKPAYATNEVLDTSNVSSAASSEVSSAVSSALSSAPDVQAQDVSSSTVSTVDNTAAHNAALQTENDRHTAALTDINTQYDPQIAALQTEITGFQAEGAADMTQDANNRQTLCDKCFNGYNAYIQWYQTAIDKTQYPEEEHQDYETYIGETTPIFTDNKLTSDYQKEQLDQGKITNLQSQKSDATYSENETDRKLLIQIEVDFA